MTDIAEPTPITTRSLVVQPDLDPAFRERLFSLKQTIAQNLNDVELELFGIVAQAKGLDPFSGQIRAVKRNTARGPVVTYQVGIDGYRSIAERTNQYRGSDEPEFGPVCPCGKPPADHPEWARVTVHRRLGPDDYIHQPARVKWHEMIPAEDFMWREKPEVMLGKTAEAAALRKAFPWVLGNVYIPEEMARPDDAPVTPAIVSARETVAAKAAELRGEDVASNDPGTTDGDLVEAEEDSAPEEPSAPVTEPLTGDEFRTRIKAAGISVGQAHEVSERLYPGRPSASLQPDEWGALWVAIQAD